jgi:hypothetical protein
LQDSEARLKRAFGQEGADKAARAVAPITGDRASVH